MTDDQYVILIDIPHGQAAVGPYERAEADELVRNHGRSGWKILPLLLGITDDLLDIIDDD
jgi:hypothetical protein